MPHTSIRRYIKQADVTSDFLGGAAGNMALGTMYSNLPEGHTRDLLRSVHSTVRTGGDIHGFLSETPTIQDIKKMDSDTGPGFVPGVADSRLLRRRRAIRGLLNEDKNSHPLSELLGLRGNIILSGLLGAGAGAGIGRYATRNSDSLGKIHGTLGGSIVGGLGGIALGSIAQQLGMLAAGTTPRRTLEEQYNYENRNNWLRHLLIPGMANYDYYKSLGASKHISEMPEEDILKEVARIRQSKGIKS